MLLSRSVKRFILGAVYCYALAYGMTKLLTDVFLMAHSSAYAITQMFMFILNFFVARGWVFTDATTSVKTQIAGFVTVAATCRFFDWLSFSLLLWLLPETSLWIAVLFAMTIVFPVKYLLYRHFVFHTRS